MHFASIFCSFQKANACRQHLLFRQEPVKDPFFLHVIGYFVEYRSPERKALYFIKALSPYPIVSCLNNIFLLKDNVNAPLVCIASLFDLIIVPAVLTAPAISSMSIASAVLSMLTAPVSSSALIAPAVSSMFVTPAVLSSPCLMSPAPSSKFVLLILFLFKILLDSIAVGLYFVAG